MSISASIVSSIGAQETLRMELDNASRPKATQPPVNTHLVLRYPSDDISTDDSSMTDRLSV